MVQPTHQAQKYFQSIWSMDVGNAYKGSRTHDTAASASVIVQPIPTPAVAINIVHTWNWADITYTIEINEKKRKKKWKRESCNEQQQ